ncbi:MAG TPA: DnaJ domain-containing protein [Noviherbaspirillum sp.]|nr:DnaJ domain-containing protein [Noviherbaspirillum sp.]
MKTLYDVLGVSRQASQEQLELAHKFCLDSLLSEKEGEFGEDAILRAKAIKEAYAVLSSPARRQAYDAKLDARQPVVTYEVVESGNFPWLKVMFAAVLLLGGGMLYMNKVQNNKAEVERAALAAQKAKAEADREAKRAAAEEARLEQQRLQEERLAQERQLREREQLRREAQVTHERTQRTEAQLSREREQAERNAKLERQREEQAAIARKRNEIAAMERALSIPIRKH